MDWLHSLFPMGSVKTKKRFGILLATVLLLQLSYHNLHVLTSHTSHSHVPHTVPGDQIDKLSTITCELCAKLLGQALYFWVYPTIFLGVAFSLLLINLAQYTFGPGTKTGYLLRGPPSPMP
ncbi:hypothetical protein [Ulvibacterium sp.]|uniref:hypothetical protein n=1 Tax=Ulvibacterium sp. TaxID=2665914 RepID=UPI003BA8A780